MRRRSHVHYGQKRQSMRLVYWLCALFVAPIVMLKIFKMWLRFFFGYLSHAGLNSIQKKTSNKHSRKIFLMSFANVVLVVISCRCMSQNPNPNYEKQMKRKKKHNRSFSTRITNFNKNHNLVQKYSHGNQPVFVSHSITPIIQMHRII